MAAMTRTIVVASPSELESTVVAHLSRGFAVTSRSPTQVVLLKRKEFSIAMMIIGLLFCLFPLFIYLIFYAIQKDQVVIVELVAPDQPPVGAVAPVVIPVEQLRWSDDGRLWWDGQRWVDVAQRLPTNATLSDDRRHWWDGESWRTVQPGTIHPGLSGD